MHKRLRKSYYETNFSAASKLGSCYQPIYNLWRQHVFANKCWNRQSLTKVSSQNKVPSNCLTAEGWATKNFISHILFLILLFIIWIYSCPIIIFTRKKNTNKCLEELSFVGYLSIVSCLVPFLFLQVKSGVAVSFQVY